jgi:hypothetical protein
MTVFWNKENSEKINGQDVIGLRKIDQSIEKEWVAGITTISQRAKYISMLVWGLVESYEIMKKSDGSYDYNEKILNLIFSRLEFIILASTKWAAKNKGLMNDFGLLGADVHKKELSTLFENNQVQIPEGKVVGLIGTYYVTSALFGIVSHDSNSPLPISITQRGKELYNSICGHINSSKLKTLVLHGGVIDSQTLTAESHLFSANELVSNQNEAPLLRKYFTEPPEQAPEFTNQYERLLGTLSLLKDIGEETNNADRIIQINFNKAKKNRIKSSSPYLIPWAEYELRRRVHFSLELILSRISKLLNFEGALTIEELIHIWESQKDNQSNEDRILQGREFSFDDKLNDFLDCKKDYDEENYTKYGKYALSMLCDLYHSFSHYIDSQKIKNRNSILEYIFTKINDSKEKSLRDFLIDICVNAVVLPHFSNTLRKMSNGAKCSLRIYLDGKQLMPTGIISIPGRSGTRLYNVINIFSDVGIIQNENKKLVVKV